MLLRSMHPTLELFAAAFPPAAAAPLPISAVPPIPAPPPIPPLFEPYWFWPRPVAPTPVEPEDATELRLPMVCRRLKLLDEFRVAPAVPPLLELLFQCEFPTLPVLVM